MAKFLPVAPARILSALWHETHKKQGLLLAHDVVAHPDAYREALDVGDNISNLSSFIIMDNSAAELGRSIDLSMLEDACKVANPDVIVLPDVLLDGPETAALSIEAHDLWIGTSRMPDMMFLPQGESLRAWVQCLTDAQRAMPDLPYIGIPRNATDRICKSRAQLVVLAQAFFPKAKIHLFGFSDNMIDDIISARAPGVHSIDSAVPIRTKNFSLTCDPGVRGKWWDEARYHPSMARNFRQVQGLVQ